MDAQLHIGILLNAVTLLYLLTVVLLRVLVWSMHWCTLYSCVCVWVCVCVCVCVCSVEGAGGGMG